MRILSAVPRRALLAAGFFVLPVAVGQVVSSWIPGNGSWGDAAKWSSGGGPNGANADVIIDGASGTNSLLTLDSGFNGGLGPTVGRLKIDAGDELRLPVNSRLKSDNTGFAGAGEWLINGLLTVPTSTEGALDGPKTINGTGKIVLGSATGRPEVYGIFTNNSTIEGAAGFGRYNNSSYWHQMFNAGLIDANVPNQSMTFHVPPLPNASTNTGTMKASNGGTLHLSQGVWNGTGGNIVADGAASRVWFREGNLFDGGTMTAMNGGLLRVGGDAGYGTSATWKNLTVNGPTQVQSGSLYLSGTVTNNGVITVPEGAMIDSHFHATDRVTVAGTGEIFLNKAVDRNNSAFGDVFGRWLIQGQTIRGRGTIGRNNGDGMDIINRGTFQADQNGQTLHMDVIKLDNQSGGFLRAKEGGTLTLSISQPIKNTGGTIEALTGGTVNAGFARIEGGLVRNVGGFIALHNMVLVNSDTDQALAYPAGGMTLRGTLDLTNSQVVRLVNTVTNEGLLRARSTGTDTIIRIGESASPQAKLTGGGEIALGDPANTSLGSGIFEGVDFAQLTNEDNLIHGFGQVGDSYYRKMNFVNRGAVSADATGKTLLVHTHTLDNTQGDLRAENGGILNLYVNMPIANEGSLIESRANSTVKFNWYTEVTGGMLKCSTSNSTFDLSHATLRNPGSGLTLQGPFVVNANNSARLVGEIANEGSITILDSANDARLVIGRDGATNVVMTGGGEIVVSDSTLNEEFGRVHQGADGAILTLQDQTLRGAGLVGYTHGGYRQLSIVNNDTISADQSGKSLQLSLVNLQNNAGKLVNATNGGTLVLDANTIANSGATVLATAGSTVWFGNDGNSRRISGGHVRSETSGILQLPRGQRAEGGVIFDNLGTAVFSEGTFQGLENGGGQFVNSGTLRKTSNSEAWLAAPLVHTGTAVTEAGILRLRGGGSITNGTFTTAAGSYTGPTSSSTAYTFSGTGNMMDGAGRFFLENSPLVLADAATRIAATNFHWYGTSSITGPGTMSFSGQLAFNNYSNSTVSGARLVNLPGASGFAQTYNKITFADGGQFENQGTFDITGGNVIEGAAGTLFKNGVGGLLRSSQNNEMRMPFQNNGNLEVLTNWLQLTRGGTFADSTASVAAPAELRVTGGSITVQGQNVISGEGQTIMDGAGYAFAAGASLDVSNLSFYGTSAVSGAGVLNATNSLRFLGYGFNTTLDGTSVRLAGNGTGLLEIHGGTLRFNNGAIFENSGAFEVRGSPAITGDGTGRLRILPMGNITFHESATFPLDLDLEGQLTVSNGRTATFNAGGLFDHTAKVILNGPSAEATFTGTTPWRARGQAVEFSGTGYVNFKDTTLQFENIDPGTPADNPDIDAGARVAFQGNNTVSGPGTLSTTGFVFQSASNTIVDGATLKTTGSADVSVWNGNGGSLELRNGAKFLNDGRFVIQSQVGAPPTVPGIRGQAGTLFHNMANGRLIHDVSTQTDFDVDFHNDGVLEFRSGTFNFLKQFTGTGGLAASGGAKVNLSLAAADLNQLPSLLQTIGANSEISIQLPNLPNFSIAVDLNGGRIVAAGAGNMVAAGGLNLVAAGGGNMVAAGGLNLVAAGGGNITATGLASLISSNGLVAAGGGNIVAAGGGNMVAAGGLNADGGFVNANGGGIRTEGAAGIVAAGAGNIVAAGGGNIVAAGAGNILSHNGGTIVAAGGGNIVAAGAGNIVAAGGGNIVAAGGGNIVAAGGGNIVAAGGGNLSGSGIFSGAGLIQNGGSLRPGMSPGILTWTGNLTVETGGVLDIEIAGPAAGTQYDRVEVSGMLSMSGTLAIQFLNGFGSTVQASDVFDIVTAGSPIVTGLAGTRVNVAGTYGSFEVQLINGGQTLRLANYQLGPVSFARWAERHHLIGADAAWDADPNGNGLSNLLEYALGLDPKGPGGSGITTAVIEDNGQRYLSLTYTRPAGTDAPGDLLYSPERATVIAPGNWSASSSDVVSLGVTSTTGPLEVVTVRSAHPISPANPREFLHLRITLSNP